MNYKNKRKTDDDIEAFVVVKQLFSAINYACGFYIVILYAALDRYQNNYELIRGPNPFKEQFDHMNRLVKNCDKNCHDQLRMNRQAFVRLCALLRNVGLSDSKFIVVEEKVAMFLNVIAQHQKNRKVKFDFIRSGQTVSRHFNVVLKAVLRLQGALLKTPEPVAADCTDDRWRCFQVIR